MSQNGIQNMFETLIFLVRYPEAVFCELSDDKYLSRVIILTVLSWVADEQYIKVVYKTLC